jgi:fatty acid desaturase
MGGTITLRQAQGRPSPARRVLRHSPWDALPVALSVVHLLVLVSAPSVPVIGIALWWNANTIAHNFIHCPFFRSRALNRAFSIYSSALLGIPQGLWRARHLRHHSGVDRPLRWTADMLVETAVVGAVWTALAFLAPLFFIGVYLPGCALGFGLCWLQGHFEHVGGTTSHYGRLYNWLFFNDGYHVEHHLRPGEHWSRLPRRPHAGARASQWPPVLRWIDSASLSRPGKTESTEDTGQDQRGDAETRKFKTSCARVSVLMLMWSRAPGRLRDRDPVPAALEWLERQVLRSKWLQRFVVRSHEHAFRALLPLVPAPRRVTIVGGGLFPRTALALRRLLPDATLTIVDAERNNLETARRFVDGVALRHQMFDAATADGADLVVIPLSFIGDRERVYEHPPARAVLVHDWIWRARGDSATVSWMLLKRLNLVRR